MLNKIREMDRDLRMAILLVLSLALLGEIITWGLVLALNLTICKAMALGMLLAFVGFASWIVLMGLLDAIFKVIEEY